MKKKPKGEGAPGLERIQAAVAAEKIGLDEACAVQFLDLLEQEAKGRPLTLEQRRALAFFKDGRTYFK